VPVESTTGETVAVKTYPLMPNSWFLLWSASGNLHSPLSCSRRGETRIATTALTPSAATVSALFSSHACRKIWTEARGETKNPRMYIRATSPRQLTFTKLTKNSWNMCKTLHSRKEASRAESGQACANVSRELT